MLALEKCGSIEHYVFSFSKALVSIMLALEKCGSIEHSLG